MIKGYAPTAADRLGEHPEPKVKVLQCSGRRGLERVQEILAVQDMKDVDLIQIKATTNTVLGDVIKFVISGLRAGKARIIRSSRGLLLVAFNFETCLCGWLWANRQVVVTRRSSRTAVETAGWCICWHRWAFELAEES